ncbi:hypothetical protein [Caldanaerobius fijiensis]|uniref:hypothetical protein n=1 Tax=Caldanaerobius fijiensis TaxID=456330 RepID=UPI0013563C55|nr:hypothetical protein [Caldanaerobius fijiensis]
MVICDIKKATGVFPVATSISATFLNPRASMMHFRHHLTEFCVNDFVIYRDDLIT